MQKITNIYKKSTTIPNRTCDLFNCDCKTQGRFTLMDSVILEMNVV